jgi:hypothetical protein
MTRSHYSVIQRREPGKNKYARALGPFTDGVSAENNCSESLFRPYHEPLLFLRSRIGIGLLSQELPKNGRLISRVGVSV